jgi:Ca2+-binding EF-hand superfamily protein
MGGAVSMPAVALSVTQQEALKARYAQMSGEGKDDEALSAELAANLSGIVLFDQIDCDHSGKVTKKELQRMLKSLPRKKPVAPAEGWPNGEAPKFVPFEEMASTLDSDGDGDVSLDEWLANLAKLPGLKAAIDGAVDPATGRISTYQSLEARLDVLVTRAAPLEAALAEGAEAGEDLASLRKQIAKLRATVGSAGVAVFRQFDADGSGKIDRAELLCALKQLPAPVMPEGEAGPTMPWALQIEEMVAALDVDGDGVIDQDEWCAQLERLTSLKAAIEQAIDPATGKVKGLDDGSAAPAAGAPVEAPVEAPAAASAPADGELEGSIDQAAANDALAKMDTDGDGKVDASELAAATGTDEATAAMIIEAADTDGDGKLDASEIAAAC